MQGTVFVCVPTITVVLVLSLPVWLWLSLPLEVAAAAVAETLGARVTLPGRAVTIPGLSEMNSAQIPVKYDNAELSCSSDSAHDCTQEITLFVKSVEGQKHFVSLLEVQLGRRESQVFMQRGTRLGQGDEGDGGEGEDDGGV